MGSLLILSSEGINRCIFHFLYFILMYVYILLMNVSVYHLETAVVDSGSLPRSFGGWMGW